MVESVLVIGGGIAGIKASKMYEIQKHPQTISDSYNKISLNSDTYR